MKEEVTESKKADNSEAMGFVIGALNLDKDRFIEVSQMVSSLIETLQRSGANPITIYYATRALEGYAQDRLSLFGEAVERSKSLGPNVTEESIRDACEDLFSFALDDVRSMAEAEKTELVEEERRRYQRDKLAYIA